MILLWSTFGPCVKCVSKTVLGVGLRRFIPFVLFEQIFGGGGRLLQIYQIMYNTRRLGRWGLVVEVEDVQRLCLDQLHISELFASHKHV